MREMLEHNGLLLTTAQGEGPATWGRNIAEPGSKHFLGKATHTGYSGLLGWLRGETIKVYETEDLSLLMSVARPWRFSHVWRVRDADDRKVGLIHGDALWNSQGERLFETTETSNGLTVNNSAKHEVAMAQRQRDSEILVTFQPTADPNPFARMMILAKVLVWGK